MSNFLTLLTEIAMNILFIYGIFTGVNYVLQDKHKYENRTCLTTYKELDKYIITAVTYKTYELIYVNKKLEIKTLELPIADVDSRLIDTDC